MGPVEIANKIYAGNGLNTGIIIIGVMEPNKEEQLCPTSYNVTYTPPSTPILTFSSCYSGCTESTVTSGSTLTYNITNAIAGNFYSLREGTSGKSLSTGVRATSSSFSITTIPLTTAGTYNI